jgi:hypothetical protein
VAYPEPSLDQLFQNLEQTLICLKTASEPEERRELLRKLRVLIEVVDRSSTISESESGCGRPIPAEVNLGEHIVRQKSAELT